MPGTDRRPRRGFVLPTTILVVTLLTVMLAAAFILVSADYRTTLNAFASARALALAQAGLQNYLSVGHNLLALTQDSTTYTFSNGWASVIARRLRDSTTTAPLQPALWVVEAIGFDTVRALSGQPNGQRAVAQFATLQPGNLPARAAITAANGDSMIGAGANPVDGRNFAFAITGCTIPARADTMGLTVPGPAGPAGGYVGPGGNDVNGVKGVGASIEYRSSASAVIDSTRIDWAKLVAGQFTPDFVGVLPDAGNNTYQSHYFVGNLTIDAGQRRGLLVVTGNVTFSSGAHWDGVIIAGGYIDFGPSFTLHGMAITGLNGTPGRNRINRAAGTIEWDWCYSHASIASLMYLVPIKNAWVDTWSTY
jgi:Tfp pilus assembly protein PilX